MLPGDSGTGRAVSIDNVRLGQIHLTRHTVTVNRVALSPGAHLIVRARFGLRRRSDPALASRPRQSDATSIGSVDSRARLA